MPRTLPWLTKSGGKPSPKAAISSPAQRAVKRSAEAQRDPNPPSTSTNETSKRPEDVYRARSPSTSPPPIPAPPEVELMRDESPHGSDDMWMMVEDEFCSTAKLYTQHIHHAEYVRLTRLAQTHGPNTTYGLQKSMNGTSTSVRIGLSAEAANARKMPPDSGKTLPREPRYSDSEGDDPEMTPQLAELLSESQGQGRDLTHLAKTTAKTRAAAGYSQSLHKVEEIVDVSANKYSTLKKGNSPIQHGNDEEDETDDDLDVAPVVPTPLNPGKRPAFSSCYEQRTPTFTPRDSSKKHKSSLTSTEPWAGTTSLAARPESDHRYSTPGPLTSDSPVYRSSEKIDTRNSPSPTSYSRREPSHYVSRKERQSIRLKREKEIKRKCKVNELPTFLV